MIQNLMKKLFGASWKTSLVGVLAIVGTICTALAAQFDGNPATDPQWKIVLPGAFTALGFLFTRDDGVTSAQAGAEPAKPGV